MTLRDLPSVQKLLATPTLNHWKGRLAPHTRTRLAREVVALLRARMLDGETLDLPAVAEQELSKRYEALTRAGMRRVINATGIVLHTNLGRAPLGRELLQEMADEISGYCTLEWKDGRRGSRTEIVERLASLYWGFPAACVVNNNAAALVLLLHALARGQGVAVSRGELVQIGGGFRVPEILEAGGARLVEVGTTNITTVRDYERALETGGIAMILRVHPSNFYVEGHTEAPTASQLSALAKKHHVPFVVDCGSAAETVEKDADLICFSGDKLLGGPQAGILLGDEARIARLRKSPLYRALRLGKLDLFCLERTLSHRLAGHPTPTEALLSVSYASLEERAHRLAARLNATVERGRSPLGGGADPRALLESPLVVLKLADGEAAARKLAAGDPPVVVRHDNGRLLLDLRTVFVDEDETLARRLGETVCTS